MPGGLARAGAGLLGLHAYNKSPQGKAHKALAERRELEGNGDVVFLPREVLQSFGQSEAPAGGEVSSSAAGMEKALGVTDTDVVKSTKEVMIDREKYERAARENPTFRAAAEAYVRYGSEGRTFSETAAEIRDNVSDPINAETPFARSARAVRDRKIQALKDAGADDRTAEAGGYIWAKSVLRRACNLGENEFGVLRDDALTPEQLDNLNVRGEKNAEADWDGAVYEQAVRAGLNLDERVPVVTLESETDKKLTPQRLLAKLTDQLDKSLGITADGEADVHVRSRGRRRLPRHIVYSSLKRLSPKKLTARSQVVNSIGDLIPHAWLVESSATNKVGKDNVAAYHRFYVPVRIGNTLHVIRVVAEESKTSKGLKPMDVDLYDVIIENSGSVMPRLTSPKRSIHSDSSVSEGAISEEITSQKSAMEITIRDMLRGVKGMDGEYYAQRSLPDAEAERERSAVVEAAKANGTYLKAPNGNKTNLTPAQWELVRSKSFHVIDDGSSVIQRTPGYPSTSYAVFDPKQIKAIDNRGTFSPDDANIYNQAVRPGIDLNERVRVINLSAAIPEVKGWNVTKLARYVKSLIGNEPSISLDALGIVGLPSKKKKYSHIAASDHKVPGELIPTRNAAVFSIEELLKNSMLVEVEDNTKKGKKPDVESYLKFYVPISANGKLYTVEIITESQEKIDPANVVLADATAYDVKLTRKKNPSPTLHRNGVSDTRGSFDVTVRQMLENVKGGRLVTEIEALNGAHLSQKRRGQIQIGPNGEGLITLFKDADRSTFFHEMGHMMLDDLIADGLLEKANARTKADLDAVRAYLDIGDMDLSKRQAFTGGSAALILINGQDPAEPLRLETITPGSFRGLLVYDRWQLWPDWTSTITQLGPDCGLPVYYTITDPEIYGVVPEDAPLQSNTRVHYSRLIRSSGLAAPHGRAALEQS